MTNEELMIADAEYWFGTLSGGELSEFAGEGGIARIAALDEFYGCKRNAEGEHMNFIDFQHRSWFALLIAEVEKDPEDVANWPFPVVHGSIPE